VAAAQADATWAAGGVPVDLAARTGPIFRADPGAFSEDGYHPSADGYRLLAEALLPAVSEAAGIPASL
ncbi:MAG TPA: SGNH/GDSL hydrolase family protein, partial [Mycobacteriales bacterium]